VSIYIINWSLFNIYHSVCLEVFLLFKENRKIIKQFSTPRYYCIYKAKFTTRNSIFIHHSLSLMSLYLVKKEKKRTSAIAQTRIDCIYLHYCLKCSSIKFFRCSWVRFFSFLFQKAGNVSLFLPKIVFSFLFIIMIILLLIYTIERLHHALSLFFCFVRGARRNN